MRDNKFYLGICLFYFHYFILLCLLWIIFNISRNTNRSWFDSEVAITKSNYFSPPNHEEMELEFSNLIPDRFWFHKSLLVELPLIHSSEPNGGSQIKYSA